MSKDNQIRTTTFWNPQLVVNEIADDHKSESTLKKRKENLKFDLSTLVENNLAINIAKVDIALPKINNQARQAKEKQDKQTNVTTLIPYFSDLISQPEIL